LKSIFNYLINIKFIIDNRKNNLQPIFSRDFEDLFLFVKDNFEKKNNAFIIDISKKAKVDLQIIHPIIALDNNWHGDKIDFGFMISITFDDEKSRLENFKKIDYYSEFEHKLLEGDIESYTLNCSIDTKKVSEVSRKILETVYSYPYYTKYYVDIHNEGIIETTMPNSK
jgi:hypothetical protein